MKPKPAKTRSFRAIDGLIVAAAALLVLKIVSLAVTASETELGPDGLPRFGHVLAHARQGYVPRDPDTTGSVAEKPKAEPAGAEAKKPAELPKAPEAMKPAAEPEPKGSPSERALRERIAERREELARRERDLETREKLMEEVERRTDSRGDETRRGPEGGAAAPEKDQGLKGLVVMYETMKPKDAARVFDRLPLDVLVPVVRQIAPRKMAEIMASMSSDSAQKLTVALAKPVKPEGEPEAVPGLPPGELQAIETRPRAPARPRPN